MWKLAHRVKIGKLYISVKKVLKGKNSVRAVLLDLDDTLYPYEPADKRGKAALTRFLSRELSVPPRKVEKALNKARRVVHKDLSGTGSSHSRLLYIQKSIEFIKRKTHFALTAKAEDLFWREYLRVARFRPGVLEFLKECKAHGVRTAIVSNLVASVQIRKIIKLGLAPHIDILVTSEEAGEEKPSPRPFTLALKKLRLPAHRVIFIGDHWKDDMEGARHSGIATVYLATEGGKPSAEADHTVRSFREIQTLLFP